MSHSAAQVSFQQEICLKISSAGMFRPVVFRYSISTNKNNYYLTWLCKNRAKTNSCE